MGKNEHEIEESETMRYFVDHLNITRARTLSIKRKICWAVHVGTHGTYRGTAWEAGGPGAALLRPIGGSCLG